MTVKMFTTPSCVYCKMAKDFFITHDISFVEVDVVADMSAREEMIRKTNQRGVPVFEINGEYVVGFNRGRLAAALGIEV